MNKCYLDNRLFYFQKYENIYFKAGKIYKDIYFEAGKIYKIGLKINAPKNTMLSVRLRDDLDDKIILFINVFLNY